MEFPPLPHGVRKLQSCIAVTADDQGTYKLIMDEATYTDENVTEMFTLYLLKDNINRVCARPAIKHIMKWRRANIPL